MDPVPASGALSASGAAPASDAPATSAPEPDSTTGAAAHTVASS
ncbi:hypothetical protein [Kitasatospora kazusensis]